MLQFVIKGGDCAEKQNGHGLFSGRLVRFLPYSAFWRHIRIQFYPAAEEMPHNIF